MGTVFERSHIPLSKWMLGFRLMASSKKGISALQLQRTLDLNPTSRRGLWRTASAQRWTLLRRHRRLAARARSWKPTKPSIGGKERNKRLCKRNPKTSARWASRSSSRWSSATAVRARSTSPTYGVTLGPIIRKHVSRKSALMTDEAGQYRPIGKEFASHETVNHGEEEYVRGDAHSNTVEGFFTILKRGVFGLPPRQEAHLQRYLAEFDFRYNTRTALGVDDSSAPTSLRARRQAPTYRRTRQAANA